MLTGNVFMYNLPLLNATVEYVIRKLYVDDFFLAICNQYQIIVDVVLIMSLCLYIYICVNVSLSLFPGIKSTELCCSILDRLKILKHSVERNIGLYL